MGADTLLLLFEEARFDEEGFLIVGGWAAGAVGVEAVTVSVADTALGEADYGRPRADVFADHPDFVGSAHSGFYFRQALEGDALNAREAWITARFAGGEIRRAVLQIARSEKRTPFNLDENLLFHSDVIDVFEDGAVYISGWAAHPHIVGAIELRINGASLGAAKLGGERADVGSVYPTVPRAASSGFTWRGAAAAPQSEQALVTFVVVTEAGETYVRERHVVVKPAPVAAPVAPPAEIDDIRIFIDSPLVVAGALAQPVRRMLSIDGWAIARNGLSSLEALLDGAPVASAIRGLRRLDIGAAFPDWPDALLGGFAVLLPRKLFSKENHVLRLEARDRLGNVKTVELKVAVDLTGDDDEANRLRPRVTQAEIELKLGLILAAAARPAFTVLVAPAAGADGDLGDLGSTLDSLGGQAYPEFRVILAASRSQPRPEAAALATQSGVAGLQIVEIGPGLDRAVAGAAENWRAQGRAPFFLTLRIGDRLGPDALMEFALSVATRPGQDFLYGDDRRYDASRGRDAACLKPQWSPDLLWSTNYIGRCWCAAAALLERASVRLSQTLPAGDYDLVLRLTEAARAIGAVPLILMEQGRAADHDDFGMIALGRAMARRRVEGGVRPTLAPGVYRTRRRVSTKKLVSIIIPTIASRGLIETCIASIRERTLYRRFEIVCVDNIKEADSPWKAWLRQHADRVVEHPAPFNWSQLNNVGAEAAAGEFLLFLNDDIEVVEPRWLHAMLEHAERSEIGVVGPRLLYPDRRIQHAGMFLVGHNARHAFRFAEADDFGSFGLAAAQREVASVTGACMLMRREVFESCDRFDENHPIVNNDVDLCLRILASGKRVVYTPHATLIHHEMASRAELRDTFDQTSFDTAWGNKFAHGDPYFNPALSRDQNDYAPEPEPVRAIVAGRPLISRADVRRILVQKLDHVGDFVTGLPAIRRLQQRFPQTEIHLLAPTASVGLARLVPEIANVIEFNFFHHVSQQGRLEYAEEDWLELEARLAPYRFDIAIDLRKHTETRDVLKHSGARLKAGYDLRGAFPWLDIALEWDGDAPYLQKRMQVADDYVTLVEAVSLACERERRFLEASPISEAIKRLRAMPGLADLRPGLFDRALVCVHPAAGNLLRQWPPSHFATLIDLIVEDFDVNIALVGAPNEATIAEETLAQIRAGDRVWSLVGLTSLAELPTLLAAARLFVGNNSGPHHLAAALGTPTIGVHSGVVSAREWGPLGPKAVALQREMSCGPCYFDKPSRCPRGLACLTGLRPAEVFRVCEQMLGSRLRIRDA